MYEYEHVRRVVYGATSPDGGGGAWFVPVCPQCGRFVRADATMQFGPDGEYQDGPNATCAKCGRVEMPFEGFI